MIDTQRTAIQRTQLSRPVRELKKSGWIPRDARILDYGCGRGTDVEFLEDMGYFVEGFDPDSQIARYKKKPKGKFHVVIVNYVVNVIPRTCTRKEVIKDAWRCVRRGGFMLVTSRTSQEISACARKSDWKRHKDGWITKHNTFQKGHTVEDLVKLIPAKLHKVGPGVWINRTVTACLEFEKKGFTALVVIKDVHR